MLTSSARSMVKTVVVVLVGGVMTLCSAVVCLVLSTMHRRGLKNVTRETECKWVGGIGGELNCEVYVSQPSFVRCVNGRCGGIPYWGSGSQNSKKEQHLIKRSICLALPDPIIAICVKFDPKIALLRIPSPLSPREVGVLCNNVCECV